MSLTRVAVGRVANLGALYDARSDTFVNDTLLNVKPNEDMIDSFDLGTFFTEIVMSNKFTEKAHKLNIEAELQASILSGLIKLQGSGKYLLENCDSADYMSMDLTYKVDTVHEEIQLRQLKQFIDTEALQQEGQHATHVVVGIDWGAQCTVTCEYSNTEGKSESEIKGAFGAKLSLLKGALDIEGKVEGQFTNKETDISKAFTFSVKSDLTPVNSSLPVSFEEAVTLAKALPEALKQTNNGKGIPLQFHFRPLDQVVKMCRFEFIVNNALYKPIEEMIVRKCTQAFEELLSSNVKFSQLRKLFLQCDFVTSEMLKEVEDIGNEFELITATFRTKFQDALRRVRSGSDDFRLMDELQADLSTKLSQLNLRAKAIDDIKEKITKVSELNKKGMTLISRNNCRLLDFFECGFVLFIEDLSVCSNSNEIFEIFCQLFRIHGNNTSNRKFLILLREFMPYKYQKLSRGKESIHYYNAGKVVFESVVEMVQSERSVCPVSLKSQPPEKFPLRKALVRLMNDNEFFQSGMHRPHWICVKCESNVEYGLDTKLLYCRCGQSSPRTGVKFCTDDILLYSKNADQLCNRLGGLSETEEINILILGETGVGKSTWINGIFNYFLYDNLREACRHEINAPIPSKFQFGGKTILVGKKSRNETLSETGESCTQGPKLYVMIHGNYKINVIDTPGVGDSRGITQDKTNFDNILAFLTNFDKLHGVCILMKPNNTRNSLWFRFCIEELLTHLHNSIVHNILFCFTNARSSFYQPGDTLPVLQEYLLTKKIPLQAIPQKNCFCFDNEAFRYLACLNNKVQSMDEHFDLFDKSWDVARNETLKMLDYVCHLKPHQIAQTISVNSAREAVLQIGRPLAEIVNRIIPENIARAKRERDNLNNSRREIGNLEKVLKIEGKSFKILPLDYPRTVCTGEGCWYFESGGLDGKESRKVYSQICHNRCTIEGLPTEAANDERLSKCYAFQTCYTKKLLKLLRVSKTSDIPGYQSTDCTDPNCKSFEGEAHGHVSVDHDEIRRRLSDREWEILNNKFSDECQHCGHSYKLHLHITYDLQTVSETFIKPDVQQQILSKKTEEEQFKALCDEFDKNVAELEEERERIFNAQVIFGAFIKSNALIPYNDAFEELVKMYINEEEALGSSRNETKLKQLRQDLEVYREKKRAIDTAASGNHRVQKSAATPDEIISVVEELKYLKHNGPALKEALDGIISSKKRQHERMTNRFLEEEQHVGGTKMLILPQKNADGSNFNRFVNFLKKLI